MLNKSPLIMMISADTYNKRHFLTLFSKSKASFGSRFCKYFLKLKKGEKEKPNYMWKP